MKNRFPTSLMVLAAAAVCANTAQSAIVYSGLQNITIPSDFSSVWVDVDGLSSSNTSPTVGWDIEVFFGGEAFGNSESFQPVRQTVAFDSPILRLEQGTLIDASFSYATQASGSATHTGTGPGQFISGTEGYLGFKMVTNEGTGPVYGWMRVNFSNTGSSGTIIDWAWDDTGAAINAGVVPEPAVLGLLGIGSLAGLRRRRTTAR